MEIEKPYPKSSLRMHMKYIIGELPENKGLTKEHVKIGVKNAFDRIDDEKIVWDDSPDKILHLKVSAVIAGVMFFFTFFIFFDSSVDIKWPGFAFAFAGVLPLIFWFICWKYEPEKKVIIFNRLEGTIQLPGMIGDRPHLIKFDDLHAALGMTFYDMYLDARRNRSWWDRMGEGVSIKIGGWSPKESWSLWVWYMDKNRPLPPGTAFDPYRQKDYERRKAEGFPPPLYESLVRTPENPKDTPKEKFSDPNYNYYG